MKLACYLFIVFFLLAGCATAEQKGQQQGQGREQVRVQNTAVEKKRNQANHDVAQHLADLATSIPTVRNATAIVLGPYAVVGIDVNAKLDRSRVETIKYSVAESLKHDPNGSNAVVVADPDTYERLKEMRKQLQNGRPSGVMEELAAIVGRVMPQVPNDTFENEKIRSTRQNDDQLRTDEKQKLKQEQNDQSNSQMRR